MPFDIRSLDGTLWLAEPAHIRRLAARVAAYPTCPTARELAAERSRRIEEARQAASKAVRSSKGKVGVVPIFGPVAQRMSPMLLKSGGTSTEEVGVALDALVADSSVSSVVLWVDSPGGESYGTEEIADRIYDARGKKKVYAIADSVCCSAGYWIGTAAEQLFATNGADVGSVGVYCCHVDQSKAMEMEGLVISCISASPFKTELSPYAPLSDSGREHLQTQVNQTYSKFLAALKRNRNTTIDNVRKNYGEGRVLNAEQALERGMIDRIMTFQELMNRLTGGSQEKESRASMDVLRARHELNKMRGNHP